MSQQVIISSVHVELEALFCSLSLIELIFDLCIFLLLTILVRFIFSCTAKLLQVQPILAKRALLEKEGQQFGQK